MVYLGSIEFISLQAVCKLCKAEYKYSGNTTNLSQHLSKVHPDELKQNSPATLQPTLQQTSKYFHTTDFAFPGKCVHSLLNSAAIMNLLIMKGY
jgi:hypothetical protein